MKEPIQRLKNQRLGGKLAIAVSLVLSMPSFSQPAFSQSNRIQEILVTA